MQDAENTHKDFRAINLIYAFAKIITTMLAFHLTSILNALIWPCYGAFIDGHNIPNKFFYSRDIASGILKNKTLTLMFMFDIPNSFRSVCWDYLLSLLYKGFTPR